MTGAEVGGRSVNLWYLKATNGMFYFATDYVRSLGREVVILAPHSLASICRENFSGSAVIEVGVLGLGRVWLRALFGGVMFFTPTPHPLPFVSRQLVVVHDSYPFQGPVGRIKRWLFQLSLATSRCKVAYINHSDSKRFVERCVNDVERRVFLPNHYPVAPTLARGRRYQGGLLTVGLVGTDSAKKNYASLFAVVLARGLQDQIQFEVFGHDTAYFRDVCGGCGQVSVRLLPSDSTSMGAFFDGIDCLVSIAHGEGFGRPIAYALSAGVPCFLIEDEVFREFYAGLATFAPTVDALVSAMLVSDNHVAKQLKSADFPPPSIQLAIERGLAVIRNL